MAGDGPTRRELIRAGALGSGAVLVASALPGREVRLTQGKRIRIKLVFDGVAGQAHRHLRGPEPGRTAAGRARRVSQGRPPRPRPGPGEVLLDHRWPDLRRVRPVEISQGDNPGTWTYHRHNAYHQDAGMMRRVVVA